MLLNPQIIDSGPVVDDPKGELKGSTIETLYLSSFPSRPLLTRQEELALAMKIDAGRKIIYRGLAELIRLVSQKGKKQECGAVLDVLKKFKKLTGLSAANINDICQILLYLMNPAYESFWKKRFSRKKILDQLQCILSFIEEADRKIQPVKEKLVERNLRLVVRFAKGRLARSGSLKLLDLIQEGNRGLMRAAERFQYRKGFKFSTFAIRWIRQAIDRSIMDCSREIRLPVRTIEEWSRRKRVERRMNQRLGRDATDWEIAEALSTSLGELQKFNQSFLNPASMHDSNGEWTSPIENCVSDLNTLPPDHWIERYQTRNEIDRILKGAVLNGNLTLREEKILRLRYGIGQERSWTLEEAMPIFSITKERIRQIQTRAIQKLRNRRIKKQFQVLR